MNTKIAINGLGRIGRRLINSILREESMDVVCINDLADIEQIVYLLKYDSVYGVSEYDVSFSGDKRHINIDGKDIKYFSIKDPSQLPWKENNIDIVVESTGVFASYKLASAHLSSGAKKVVVSAPVKDSPIGGIKGTTALVGVNEKSVKGCSITSNASCTTNASAIPIKILDEAMGVEKAILNTIHSYTVSQSIVDSPKKGDLRASRSAGQNIVPFKTGAAIATTLAYPKLKNKFDGIALRVPTICGSIADITFISKKHTTVKEVNDALTKASSNPMYSNLFYATEEPIVSADILGTPYSAIADLKSTRVVDGNLVKVLLWYDNESGYANTLLQHIKEVQNNL